MADKDDLRRSLLDILLDKVAEERYPSVTMLDLIEAMIKPDELSAYVAILLGHIRESTYPSMDMIRRVEALAAG
jgi:hypothetical protein